MKHTLFNNSNSEKLMNGINGLGIITTESTNLMVLSTLNRMGLDTALAYSLGIGVTMINDAPVNTKMLLTFSHGRPELIVIEIEKEELTSRIKRTLKENKETLSVTSLIIPFDKSANTDNVQLKTRQLAQFIAERLSAYGLLTAEIRQNCNNM